MIKKIIFILPIFALLLVNAQHRILFSNEYKNSMHTDFVKENNLESVIIFYQDEFVLNDQLFFNKEMLKKTINDKIPNRNSKGYAVLDWENSALNVILTQPINSKQYNAVIQEFVKAIEFAKKERPFVQWGFYNIPAVNYGSISRKQEDAMYQRYLPIMMASDFLAPSLYLLNDRKEVADSFVYKYAEDNTKASIKFAKRLNKEVFPFVWHRYTGVSKSENKLIETFHFENFIKTIQKSQIENNKISGLIWWDCERYLFNNRYQLNNINAEYRGVKNTYSYQKSILEKYLKYIK